MQRLTKVTLACFLLATAWMKLGAGFDSESGLSKALFSAIIIFEAAAAGFLCSRFARYALAGLTVFAMLALAHAVLLRPETCGCLGKALTLGWRGEALLACILGLLTSACLVTVRAERIQLAR